MTELQSLEVDQVFSAFVSAQAEFLHVAKLTEGARGKFAAFPDVVEQTRPVLNRNGLFITQLAQRCEGGALVVTKVGHVSGQWFSDGGMFVPAAKHDPQGIGSALSYSKRYAWLAVCGVATDDDDGAAALQGIEREQAREAASKAVAATPTLTADQREILMLIAKSAGSDNPTLDGLLAEDFPRHVARFLAHASKQGVFDQDHGNAIALKIHEGATIDQVDALLRDQAVPA